MDDTYRKSKGNAGLEGVQFQLDLLTVCLLNALHHQKNWRISSENQQAGKYDDLVLELPDKSVFLQAKFKQTKKISRDQVFSNNSKNADFSLPKYFFSYLELKSEAKERSVIICTNTDINQKSLKDLLTFHQVSSDSMLHYEEATCSYFTFNKNVLPDLKANAEIYLDKNLQGKGIDKAVITDESMEDFLNNLQFFYNYPSGEQLHKIIEQLLFRLRHFNLCCKVSYYEIYRKVEDWFKQPKGEYLTECRTKAMLCEIRSDSYCQSLKDYNISFESNCFNFTYPHRIINIKCMGGYMLHILKIFHAIQSDKIKKLYVNPRDEVEIQKYIVEAFELRQYRFLIMVWTKIENETIKVEISNKLRNILQKDQYKKIILITEDNSNLAEYFGLEHIYEIDEPVTFNDLSKNSQERLLKIKNVLFQGEKINLEELLGTPTTEEYTKQLHIEILEKIIRGEEVKVGQKLLNLDKDIACYYIPRVLESEDCRFWKKADTIPEQKLFDVNQKVVLISDSAGMGKSTLLTKIAIHTKNRNSFLWVIKINLQDYTGILKDFLRKKKVFIRVVELLNFRAATALTSKFEEYVFSINEKVVLLLDGVDEISPNYTGLILRLIIQCQAAANIAKIFLTTRPHVTPKLLKFLKVVPFYIIPFTRENQIDFLTKYWIYNVQLVDINKKKWKCEQYAKMLIAKISLWTEPYYSEENPFGAIPLQVRMMAEIFQEKYMLESMNGESCSEYLNGDNEVPKLPENFNITELYDMFIEKKRDIFLDKGNPSGNTAADQALINQFEECLAHHRNLALKVILTEGQRNLFSNYCEGHSSLVLKIGIVQECEENFFFVHRTFAEYFVAESILQELQQDSSVEFQEFLIDEILVRREFKLIRGFFDRGLQKIVQSLSCDIFKKYQSHTCESNLNLIFHLSTEGCVAVLQFIFKSINFKIIKNTNSDIEFWRIITKKRNTLNDLQILVQQSGVNIRNEFMATPLEYAIRGNSLEMVKFLIEQGADVNFKNQSALHSAAQMGRTNIIAYFLENSLNVNDGDDYGRTPLHLGATNGNLDVVSYLVELGVNVNIKDYDLCTPLHRAARGGQLKTVKYLVEHGANIKDIDDAGNTPLHLAAGYGNMVTVKYILECGSDKNIRNSDGDTVLHCAVKTGEWDNIKCLVDSENINDINGKDRTPLHLAAYHRGPMIVKHLVEHGASVNNKDSDGNTALHLAIKGYTLDVIKYLVELELDVNCRNAEGRTPLHFAASHGGLNDVNFLVERGSNIHVKDNDGNTLLHMAAEGNKFNTVKYLVELGVNVNDRGTRGRTPLQLVARYGNLDAVNYLVEHGSDINAKDNDACTSLHWAAEGGQLNIVQYFVTHGINVNDTDDKGRTPLHLAVRCGRLDVVNYLLKCGSNNTKDNNGGTLLHWTAQGYKLSVEDNYFLEQENDIYRHFRRRFSEYHSHATYTPTSTINAMKKLTDYFVANVNEKDDEGRTPLHLGARYRGRVFVRYLVERGSDVNIKDNGGRTALHWAAEEGDSSTVDYLVQHGVNVNSRDNKGHTPLHLAARYGKFNVVKYLVECDLDVNIKGNDGRTALQLASESDKLYITRYLEKFNERQKK